MGKKKVEFNIIKNAPTDGHKGFGVGSLNLENITPLIIDVEEGEVWIDEQVMHARSKTERGVKYLKTKEELLELQEDGIKQYWIIWVAVDRDESGPYYAGVTACELQINRSIRRGYKSMPEHVNHLDRAMKGHVIVSNMDEKSRAALAQFLQDHDQSFWDNSREELKAAFAE